MEWNLNDTQIFFVNTTFYMKKYSALKMVLQFSSPSFSPLSFPLSSPLSAFHPLCLSIYPLSILSFALAAAHPHFTALSSFTSPFSSSLSLLPLFHPLSHISIFLLYFNMCNNTFFTALTNTTVVL